MEGKKKYSQGLLLVSWDAIRYAQDSFFACFWFLQSMPDSASYPLCISRITWWRKKPTISLLAVWHLALLLLLLLLLAFKSSPMICLPLITVIYQESQGASKGNDDE